MKNHRDKMIGNQSVANKIPKGRSEQAGTIVRIVEYNAAKHLVKVVRASDNKPLEKDVDVEVAVEQRKPFEKPQAKVLKTLAAPNAPTFEVNDNFVSIRGNADYGFFSFREGGGNIIKGPLSIATDPHQIRLAGITTLNPLITTCFPSTIVTPMPTAIWSLPSAKAIQPLLKDVTIMATLVSAMGAVS